MIIMKPISTPQTISIIPRDSSIASATLFLKRDGDGADLTQVISLSDAGNYKEITFSSTILKEGYTYFLEISDGTDLIYRDKVFVTAKDNFKIKHKILSDSFTQYNEVDDNTYKI